MDTITKVTQYPHTCKRCGGEYVSTFRNYKGEVPHGLCPKCKEWLKKTKYTHCHKTGCGTKFDIVKDTKYGPEYHCPKCDSWINFGLLADVFSLRSGR